MKVKINGEYVPYTRRAFNEDLKSRFPDDGSILHNYSFTEGAIRPKFGAKLLKVPVGYQLVNQWNGDVDRNRPTKGPGLRAMVGLFGFGQSGHVINTRVQKQDLESDNLFTADNVPLRGVDSTVFYRVFDPARAVAAIDFRDVVFSAAEGRVSNYVANRKVIELSKGDWKAVNLIYNLDGTPADFSEPRDAGVEISKIVISEIPIPESLEERLAGPAIGASERERIKLISQGQLVADKNQIRAAAFAADKLKDPVAMQARELEVQEAYANGPNNTIVVPIPRDINVNVGRP